MTLLTRWEPLHEFSTMQDRMSLMNRLFGNRMAQKSPEEALTTTNFAPPVDNYEDEHTIRNIARQHVPGGAGRSLDTPSHVSSCGHNRGVAASPLRFCHLTRKYLER